MASKATPTNQKRTGVERKDLASVGGEARRQDTVEHEPTVRGGGQRRSGTSARERGGLRRRQQGGSTTHTAAGDDRGQRSEDAVRRWHQRGRRKADL
jgi:hypothetical protein